MSADSFLEDLLGRGGGDALAELPEVGVEIREAFFPKFGSPGGRGGVDKRFPFFNARAWGKRPKPERVKRDTNAARRRRRGRPHGRPTVLSPDMCEKLCLLLSVGLSRRRAAKRLGIDPGSITYRAKRDEAFRQSLEAAIGQRAEG